MINRRHLRIKVLQSLYAYFLGDETNYKKAETELIHSIERIYDLYLYLLLSFEELKTIHENKINENRLKARPTAEDLDPNLKFINNRIFNLLSNSTSLRHASEMNKVNWLGVENHEMFKKILNHIKESEVYFSYIKSEEDSFENDKEFICQLFKEEIANSNLIYNFFEEKSIHWLDDIDLACSLVLKTIKSIDEEEENNRILPLYKDEEDEVGFYKTLFRKTILLDNENEQLIDDLTKNWEFERIAKMDVILMKMAITELQEFQNIPKKVTLNEYIEISKYYSTPKSSGFINGILDQAVSRLETTEKIRKIGRGLMD